MMRESTTQQGREAAGKIFLGVLLIILIVAIFRVSVWSFMQTWEFTKFLDLGNGNDKTIGLAFAMIIQYGQNPALWQFFVQRKIIEKLERQLSADRMNMMLKQKLASAKKARNFYAILFLILSVTDALTNIGQFNKEAEGMNQTQIAVGNIICVIVVFVEEALSYCMSWLLHIVNDIREIYGRKRWASLDAFDPSLIVDKSMSSAPVQSQQPSYQSSSQSLPRHERPAGGVKMSMPDEPTYQRNPFFDKK